MLQTFSQTTMTLMIPEIAKSLDISELSAQWVVSAYLLAYAWYVYLSGSMVCQTEG